jgi:hypothetical protein
MGMSVSSVVGGAGYVYGPPDRTTYPDAATGAAEPVFSGGDAYVPTVPGSSSSFSAYGPSARMPAPAAGAPSAGLGSGSASAGGSAQAVGGAPSAGGSGTVGSHECRTCAERTYQDVSSDPGVSFKAATHVSPEAAAMAVSSHEAEHVGREQMKATAEGSSVVSQYVRIHTSVCQECGRVYVSGGTTTTVTESAPKTQKSQGIDVTV